MNSDVCKQDHSSTSSRYARWPQLRRVLPASLRPFLCSRRLARIERAPASARSLELAFSSSLCATGLHPTIRASARTFAHASSLALLPARPTTLLALHSPPRKAVPSSMSAIQIDSKRLQRMQTTPHDIARLRNDPARYRTTALRLRSTLFVHLR